MVITFHKNVICDAFCYGSVWDIYAHDLCIASIMLVHIVILMMLCHLILIMVMLHGRCGLLYSDDCEDDL